MRSKKILFDARGITSKPCGVRNVAQNYLRELARNHDIIALVAAEAAQLVDVGIKTKIAPKWASRFSPASDIWVSFQVLKCRPEIFLSAHSFLPVLAVLPKQKVFICHDLFASFDKDFFRKRGWLAPLARFYFRFLSEISFFRANLVVAPSASIADSFEKLLIRPKRVAVIHNGINIPAHPSSFVTRRNQILYVGNFRSYKGFDTLFEAWKMIVASSEANDWGLEVVTNEPQESIRRFIEERGVIPRINFHSRISDSQLDQIRSQARIAIVPSRQEGFGLPLLEAISAGGLVIHSDIAVFREIAVKLTPGSMMSFPPGDVGKLAETILATFRRGDVQQECLQNNRAKIRQAFSWRASTDHLIAELG